MAIGVAVVVLLLVAGGATALAASSSGNGGYRMGKVVRASVASNLVVVGTIEPVNDASASFQVAGQVASVTATAGEQVTAGETLASLDPTSLSESVSSADLSLESANAKLTEDEDSETSSTTSTAATLPKTSTATGTAGSSPITGDQATLIADQASSSTEQQQEAADLSQAETACGITTTTTTSSSSSSSSSPTDDSACTTGLEQVSTDQQSLATDEKTVASDEATLAKAITQEESSSSSGSPSSSGSGTSSVSGPTSTGSGSTSSNKDASTSGAASDSAAQIASDEAAIDTARANVVGAQQDLADAQLTSPINGTIVSVGINAGDTVSAASSTEDIVIIGTNSFEATATLTSSQVPSIKVGAVADVAVDGTTGTFAGTVSQVGPVQSSDGTYSYPVVVALPSAANNLFSGSSANISIVTGAKTDVLAVPTSAVEMAGTQSYVIVLSGGNPVDKTIKVGIVGGIYTQVLSGLKLGDDIVLANYSTPVPASNTTTVGGFGGGTGGFGGVTGGFGGGAGRFTGGGAATLGR